MASKMVIRSCGSSVRTLIRRHLRPTVATTNVKTETPASIYNFYYLLPNSIAPRTVNLGDGFSIDAVEYSMSEEVARARRTFNASKEDDSERMVYEEVSDDDSELDESIFEDFEDDDDDDDDDGDENDDDGAPRSSR